MLRFPEFHIMFVSATKDALFMPALDFLMVSTAVMNGEIIVITENSMYTNLKVSGNVCNFRMTK